MTTPIRLALVGCGNRGIYLASLFKMHPLCRITTVMDTFPACTDRAIKDLDLREARVFHDFENLLHDAPADALLITCDPTLQVDFACRAMESGRHACTEVPAAFTIDECWRLVRTQRETGRKYQLMEQARYWGFVDVWRSMVKAGELGHICLAQGEYIHYEERWNYWVDPETGAFHREIAKPAGREVVPTWRNKVFQDPILYLPHTLSPLLKILDTEVVSVSCMGTKRGSYTYPDTPNELRDVEYALMHTAGDHVLMVGAGFSMPHVNRGPLHSHWYELRGGKGSVTSPRYPSDHFRVWHRGDKDYKSIDLGVTPIDATAAQAKSGHGGADYKPVDTFLRAIAENTLPPVDALLAAQITAPAILAAESARQGGKLLQVPDFRGG